MIAIVNSGGANISSVMFAIERLGKSYVFTDDPDDIRKASHVVFPGVGAASAAMRTLREKRLIECLKSLTQPVLGICLGMQLLFERSQEGDVETLGLLPAAVTKFIGDNLTVPHTGWNTVKQTQNIPLFKDIADNAYFFFVHSYYVPDGVYTVGRTKYSVSFSSVVVQDNYFGCQFHPERSGSSGAQLLRNFVEL
jgi:imidazole glycerol-phosphate synthase subunit HisH